MADGPELDVAIVGAGVSGIYTAWRILKAVQKGNLSGELSNWQAQRGGHLKVGVFEGDNRVGGRLLSARSPLMPNVTCELGGMRYLSTHTRVATLVKQLGIEPDEQIVVPKRGSNICFVRNKRLSTDELTCPHVLPYHFNEDEKPEHGKSPISIIEKALRKALPDFERSNRDTLYCWLKKQRVDGIPLYYWGFWNLLLRGMSSEGYEAAIDTIGYDVLGANYNAVDMIAEIFEFDPTTKYLKLSDGYEKIPWTLAQQFKDYGGRLNLNCWLQGFEYNENVFTLKFEDIQKDKIDDVTARALVLAMPRHALERLLCTSPRLQPHQNLLNAVSPIRLFKQFLIYKTPWWEQDGIFEGRSLTDLPVRQCYYWAVSEDTPNNNDRGPAAIMVYNDVINTDYWRGLIPEPIPPEDPLGVVTALSPYSHLHPAELRRRTIDTAIPPKPVPLIAETQTSLNLDKNSFEQQLFDNWAKYQYGSGRMAEDMHRMLLSMHGAKPTLPQPCDSAVADWPDAVHLWNVGYPSWDIRDRAVKPDKDAHWYICGEAYSTYQTWVEGALQTSQSVLKRLGVMQP